MTRTGRPPKDSYNFDGKLSKAEKDRAISIFNEADPDAVINMLPPDMVESIKTIPEIYFTWSEAALEKHAELDTRDYQLRISFWNEYNHMIENNRDAISLAQVIRGVCTKHYWQTKVLTNPKKLAWIMFPPADYIKFMAECLHQSMRRMRQVLAQDIKGKDGKLNYKLIELQMKIWEKVELRVKGAVPQALNINQKSLNMNVNQNVPENVRITNSTDMAAIDAELAALEGKETPLIPEGEKAEKPSGFEGPAIEVHSDEENHGL